MLLVPEAAALHQLPSFMPGNQMELEALAIILVATCRPE